MFVCIQGYRSINQNGWTLHRHLVVATEDVLTVRFYAGPDNCVEVDEVSLVQVQAAGACRSVFPLDLSTATVTASSSSGNHIADAAVDGRQFTYWESLQDSRGSFDVRFSVSFAFILIHYMHMAP